MKEIFIDHKVLERCIEETVCKQSGGVAPIKIQSIVGVSSFNGERFAISGVNVEVASPKPSDFLTRTPPAGKGKIRLATNEGQEV